MATSKVERFHKLYGTQKRRTNYQEKDFLDYLFMLVICQVLIVIGFGPMHPMTWAGAAVCVFMAITFPINHGLGFKVPVVLHSPQDVIFLIIHKIQNIKAPYFMAIALLVAENVIIHYTPDWPHHVDWMRRLAIGLFWLHVTIITVYRTTIFIAHMRKREHIREILLQSAWKGRVGTPGRTTLSVIHAYMTGLLTHMVYLVPWYLVLTHVNYSLVLAPATIALAFLIQKINVKTLNDWFYRDHWLSHNSEFDFIYLHGVHHDAIPSGMIAVAGNGPLESLVRSAIAFPIPFYNPLPATLFYTFDVKSDIDMHQYIPGVFPKLPKDMLAVMQHSLHHFGRLEPYGFAINLDLPITEEVKKRTKLLPDELKYSIRLDQELNGYVWDNPKFRWYMDLVERYHDLPEGATAAKAKVQAEDAGQ